MDKNFRIAGKVSIADLFFIAAIIAALFFLREFAAPQTVKADDSVKINYTVELYRKDRDYINNVVVGEKLTDIEKGYEIGTIVDVYAEPYLEDSADFEAKTYKRAEVAGISNIYVVVEANAQISANATNIGQYQVMVGKEAFVQSKSFASGAFIVGIERMN
ncbi:MAG: DUF4330 domain-containing protein [Clostridiales bacterium]|jgi:hypothetical protein|nr:DUF4330 domain-containing protein [Clostridiales bacterium]